MWLQIKGASVSNLCRSSIFSQKSYPVTQLLHSNFTPYVSGCCKDAILWIKWAPAKQNKTRYLSPCYLKITLKCSFCSYMVIWVCLVNQSVKSLGFVQSDVSECWKVGLLGVPKMLPVMSVLKVVFVLPVSVSNMNHRPWAAQPGCSRHHHNNCIFLHRPHSFVCTPPICPERSTKSLFSGLRGSSFCWVNSWYVAWHLHHPLSPVFGARPESLCWGGFLGLVLVTITEMKSQILGLKQKTAYFLKTFFVLCLIHSKYIIHAYTILYALTNFLITAQLQYEDLGVLL